MKTEHFLLLAVVLYFVERHAKSQQGMSAIDSTYAREVAQFGQMNGTNFTNSVWDASSGQPGYMFGNLNVPGGASIGTTFDPYASYVGHA